MYYQESKIYIFDKIIKILQLFYKMVVTIRDKCD